MTENQSFRFDSLPKHLIELLQWKDKDNINFNIAGNGEILLTNKSRKPIQGMDLALNTQEAKYKFLGKKKYNQELQKNMSKGAKRLLGEKYSRQDELKDKEMSLAHLKKWVKANPDKVDNDTKIELEYLEYQINKINLKFKNNWRKE